MTGPPGTVLTIRNDGSDLPLLRVGTRVKLGERALPRVHSHSRLLRKRAVVDGYIEVVCRRARSFDRMENPPIPSSVSIDEHELCVMEPDTNDNGLDVGTLADKIRDGFRSVRSIPALWFVLKRPRTPQMTRPPSTHSTCPVM
jgi:hypothetical protein